MPEHLDEVLTAVLRPLVKEIVAEEVRLAGFQWSWRTPEQAGRLLGISANAVRKRAHAGTLPAKFENGRIWIDMREYQERLDRL